MVWLPVAYRRLSLTKAKFIVSYEAATEAVLYKKISVKILENLQENICVRASLLIRA